MTKPIREELQDFEKELAHVIAKFLKLYERLEKQGAPVPKVQRPQAPVNPHLPGYH